MIIAALFLLGLCLGSFANALVWRIYQQDADEKQSKKVNKRVIDFGKKKRDSSASVGITSDESSAASGWWARFFAWVPEQARNDGGSEELSILRGRSMCPKCRHPLAAKDLIPVLSWLSTRGKCRYCSKKISIQYPIVEIATALVFVASYTFWPQELIAGSLWPMAATGSLSTISYQLLAFCLWLVIVTGLMALLVYDLRWYLLPNRIVYPLSVIAGLFATLQIATASDPLKALADTALAVAIGGGIFYVLFQVSKGKWIGGGDVKLGWLLGLVLATPGKAVLMIFIAALLGTIVSLPLLLNKKLKRTSVIPFGPFLIIGAIIAQLFGADIIDWYLHSLLLL